MLRSLTTHIAIVCFKCIIKILQVFYVDVVKVDLDVLSGCFIFKKRFEYFIKHQTNIAAEFFSSSSTDG